MIIITKKITENQLRHLNYFKKKNITTVDFKLNIIIAEYLQSILPEKKSVCIYTFIYS